MGEDDQRRRARVEDYGGKDLRNFRTKKDAVSLVSGLREGFCQDDMK